jgi:CheY-like chemotaxis protein
MSHELRTPLNSLLILSDQLSHNVDGNLTQRQVEFAQTIHSSGNDLLALINDILDLSKVESGTVAVDVSQVSMRDLQDYVERTFRHVAESKRLEFEISFASELPDSIHTDAKRLQQVIKNLLSNAFKFTERGKVSLEIGVARSGWGPDMDALWRAGSAIAIAVRDTGIGIPDDKQQIIFEAFQQADGSSSRKYGGTGLGLAISREIVRMLGGEIKLTSRPHVGSTFTVFLPPAYVPLRSARRRDTGNEASLSTPEAEKIAESEPSRFAGDAGSAIAVQLVDDSASLRPRDRVLLIIESDPVLARVELEAAHAHGYKAIVCHRGAAALSAARERSFEAILLDVDLPDMDGWRILDRLKDDMATRHILVQVIASEEERLRALRVGAIDLLTKPLTPATPSTPCLGA